MMDVKNERKRRSMETVLPVSRKPKAVRLLMPARTMAPIEEEEGQKDQKSKNVTTRRPLRGRSMFVAPSIVEESDEVSVDSEGSEKAVMKKMEPEKPKNVAKMEVAKNSEDKKKKKKNYSK